MNWERLAGVDPGIPMAASDWSHSFRIVREANLVSEAMLIVIGGHSRNVGKTSMTAAINRSTSACQCVAVRISAHRHGGRDGPSYVLSEEHSREGHGDGSRFRAADAYVLVRRGGRLPCWRDVPIEQMAHRPVFEVSSPGYGSSGLIEFIETAMSQRTADTPWESIGLRLQEAPVGV